MAAVRPKPGFSSKRKQAKQDGKNPRAVVCADNEGPFTAEWYASRRKIEETLRFYRELLVNRKLFDELSQEPEKSSDGKKYSGIGVHMRAARVLESSGGWVNTSKQIGHVSGIKVGDDFRWRGELSIVGLHHEFQKGIDYMKLINGKTLATSIVDSGRYENGVGITSDVLIYCGEGENPNLSRVRKPKDQKLVGGNLALKNSMDSKTPVRVIRRLTDIDTSKESTTVGAAKGNDIGYKFVYDGLYRVTGFWKERGKFGRYVYKFSLKRIERQPELDLGKWNKVGNGSAGSLFKGKENDIY
ncbi:hypothetical protein QUC31_015746 [Theobroma cacao]